MFAGFITRLSPEDNLMGEGLPDASGAALAGLEPGTMQELPPGRKITFADPPSAGSDYAEFLRGHLLAICASQDVPYEVLTGDLRNVSDRALRLILNEFRRVIEQDQWLYMIPMFCQKVRDAWFDQAVLVGQFFDGQHLAVGPLQVAVSALARGQCFRLATELLAIQLLIRLSDENHPIRRQTKRATAIFVHPAAHTEAIRRQTFRHAVAPVPDPASGIFRAIFIPEQTVGTELQFGEVHAGGDGLGGAERLSPWR